MVGLNLQSDFVKSPNNHLYGEEPGAGRSVGIEWVLTELSCDFGKSRGFCFPVKGPDSLYLVEI